MYKNETGFISFPPYSKGSILNVAKTLNVRPETLKLVRKNIDIIPEDISILHDILKRIPRK